MKLILHIGNHKTGSTTIQNSLNQRNEDLLNKYGLLYPKTFLVRGAHHYLPTLLLGSNTLFGENLNYSFPELIADFKEEIDEKKPEVIFLSSEEFFRFNSSQIMKLKPLFDMFDSIDILVYLRNQSDHIESSYKFGILWEMTQNTSTFESLVQNVLSSDYHDYHLRLNQWLTIFPDVNMIVKDFRKEIKKGLLKAFYSEVLKFDIKVQDEKNNASLSRLSSLILKIFNSINISANERKEVIEILGKYDDSKKTKESILTNQQYEDIVKKFYQSNELLKNKYNVELNLEFKDRGLKKCSGEKFNHEDKKILNKFIDNEAIFKKYQKYLIPDGENL